MLNQLIESTNDAPGSKNRRGLLLTTFVLVAGLCLSALTYSLFAKDFGTGNGELELSTLIAPIAENAPSAPVEKQKMPEPANKIKSSLPTRQANILRIDEQPQTVPKDISTVPNTQRARPIGDFITSDNLETDGSPGSSFGKTGNGAGQGIGIADNTEVSEDVTKRVPPPALNIKKPVEEKIQKPRAAIVTGGVVNGKAKFLPKPIYTAAAKAIRAAGDVNVQVTIDETGNVISAKAVDGHPMLRTEAEKAARSAKFDPTLLTGQPVKVSGIIIYKFSM